MPISQAPRALLYWIISTALNRANDLRAAAGRCTIGRSPAVGEGSDLLDYQELVFGWVLRQHWAAALVLTGAGMVYAFQGYRLFRFLLCISAGVVGWLAGQIAGITLDFPPLISGACTAGIALVASLQYEKSTVVLINAGTWGLLGHYIGLKCGIPSFGALALLVVAGGVGALLSHISLPKMRLALTTLQGVMLIVIGLVGVSQNVMPTVSSTFRDWSSGQSLLVPALLGMLAVIAYSIQSNSMRGDMRSGV